MKHITESLLRALDDYIDDEELILNLLTESKKITTNNLYCIAQNNLDNPNSYLHDLDHSIGYLNEAILYDPSDMKLLLLRAKYNIKHEKLGKAQEDLDVVIKSKNSSLREEAIKILSSI